MLRFHLRKTFVFTLYTLVGSFFLLALLTQVSQNDNWAWTAPPSESTLSENEDPAPQSSREDEEYNPKLEQKRHEFDDGSSGPLRDLMSNVNEKLWFFNNGTYRPHAGDHFEPVWPCKGCGGRIPEQLMVGPRIESPDHDETPLKTIVLANGLGAWNGMRAGPGVFLKSNCPVNRCVISGKKSDFPTADALLFKDSFSMPKHKKPSNQVWIMYMLESPLNTPSVKFPGVINWTATYRLDSDIVAPYESWQYFDPSVTSLPPSVNFAANKTKKVAWFVSNCAAKNNRLEYAKELQKHIEVDIYGGCGTKNCPRTKKECYEMLKQDYKFYLAFENSNCRDYITEKFFVNGLMNGILPIVMGAPREDYEAASPLDSFIHVDDFSSPKELAQYLKTVDENDELYNQYFRWHGTGEFINTHFWCRLCALLHEKQIPAKVYDDYDEWWKGKLNCINKSWRELKEFRMARMHRPKN